MDSKLKETELVERYVLNQLNDEELALFRGRLMFDEALRKQVVETKMLIKNLQIIAKGGKFGAPSKTSTGLTAIKGGGWNRQRILSVAAAAAGVILIATVAMRQDAVVNNTMTAQQSEVDPKVEQSIENASIAAKEEVLQEEAATEKPTTAKAEKKIPTVKKQVKENRVTNVLPKEEVSGEDRIFAEASPKKRKSAVIDFSAIEEEMTMGSPSMGFADNSSGYPQNEYLEDAIVNSISKSNTINVVVEKKGNNNLIKDKNGAVHIAYNGTIETKGAKNKYRFKIFTNDMDEYLDNMPKYQTQLTTSKKGNKDTFDLDFKIDLPKGLYYYIIEEEVNDEYDMIYADKFIVK